MTFDSKLECAVHGELLLLERAGIIRDLQHQPGTVFLSQARIQYRPDFRFINCDTGKIEYAEAKGYADPKWPLKKKLWKFYGPGKLTIYGGSYRKVSILEVIEPKGETDE